MDDLSVQYEIRLHVFLSPVYFSNVCLPTRVSVCSLTNLRLKMMNSSHQTTLPRCLSLSPKPNLRKTLRLKKVQQSECQLSYWPTTVMCAVLSNVFALLNHLHITREPHLPQNPFLWTTYCFSLIWLPMAIHLLINLSITLVADVYHYRYSRYQMHPHTKKTF